MHNLSIGSAKHFLKVLIDNSIVSDAQFNMLHSHADRFNSLATFHITCFGFASFTADQWKNWVVYFSLVAMCDTLDNNRLECWRHFVQACRVRCGKKLMMEHVLQGNVHLLQFSKRTQIIFRNHIVTPDIHMHCHICSKTNSRFH